MDKETIIKKVKRIGCLVGIVALLIGCGVFYFRYYWPFGDGVKSGVLNYIVHKGYVFKTYEGRIILAGFTTTNANSKSGAAANSATGGIQSNEFLFSITDKNIAEKLMHNSGKEVMLHYHEYFATLPWRGVSKYVVDSIVSIENPNMNMLMPPATEVTNTELNPTDN